MIQPALNQVGLQVEIAGLNYATVELCNYEGLLPPVFVRKNNEGGNTLATKEAFVFDCNFLSSI
jgi:hypothetical protein